MKTALIGLGAIGAPIAHKLFSTYKDDFFLILNNERQKKFEKKSIYINGDLFNPLFFSEKSQKPVMSDLLIVCIKNYSLKNSLENMKPFITPKTMILPLQNGIYSYQFFKEHFPENYILSGYVQGPNTERNDSGFIYRNSGELHIGSEEENDKVKFIEKYLHNAGIPVFFETDIKRKVWKKWMLNIAGNSVTALTGADYSLFKTYPHLQLVCRQAMQEFLLIANAEKVKLNNDDIDDVIEYFVSYIGKKRTSMLVDVLKKQKTENDYLAGTALALGIKHEIPLPIISTLYYLMEIKEKIYNNE